MSLSLGVHSSAVHSNGTDAIAPAISTSSGSCIIIGSIWQNNADLPTITDSKNCSWTQIGTSFKCYDSGGYLAYMAFWKNEGGSRGSSHTFTSSKNGCYPSIWVQEIIGNTPVVDTVNTGVLDTSSPWESNSYTPGVADEYLLCLCSPAVAGTATWGNSFTSNGDDLIDDTNYWVGTLGYRLISSITAYVASVTIGGSPIQMGFQIVGVKETAVAGQPTSKRFGGVPFVGQRMGVW